MSQLAYNTKVYRLGKDSRESISSLSLLGWTYLRLDRYQDALGYLEESTSAAKRHLGVDDPETLTSMSGLGQAYIGVGRRVAGLRILTETLTARKRVLGEEHRDTLRSVRELSWYMDSKDQRLSECEKAVAKLKISLGPGHGDTLEGMDALGWAYEQRGLFKEAAKTHREALRLREEVLGWDHKDTARSWDGLGFGLYGWGLYGAESNGDFNRLRPKDSLNRANEALKCHEKALEIRKRIYGEEHSETLRSGFGYWQACGLIAKTRRFVVSNCHE